MKKKEDIIEEEEVTFTGTAFTEVTTPVAITNDFGRTDLNELRDAVNFLLTK